MSHPFGDLLRQYRARKAGLSQTRLAELAGYDQAVLVRMSQGRKDLTGPSGRERVVRLITVLRDERALLTQDEANALLKAAGMSPLFEGQPVESALLQSLKAELTPYAPPASTPAAPLMHNLPAPLTRFVGREREMAEVMHLLNTTRLLTLTGSGGCGKTRLAINLGVASAGAKRQQQSAVNLDTMRDALPPHVFPDGIWLAQLASVSDPAPMADAVATTLGLRAASRPARDLLADYLVDKRMLLILDNCEHLIQACAELVEALLSACPELHILATSREGLNIPGEVTWRVPSLAADEAVQLFMERARAAKPDFTRTEQNAASMAQICTRLDNIPLAIELAAARLRTFSVQQVASRLSDTFALLTGGSRTALPRQQTLRATIDWSYALLTEEERALLRHLAAFAGGWTLEAAEAVCANVGARTSVSMVLDQLVNKSLVIVEEGTTETRYHLLETVRQYAHEKLAEAGAHEQAHASHLAFFADIVQVAQSHFHGPQELEWLDRLDTEIDNVRAALERCAQTGDVPTGERLVDGLWYWWWARGYLQEGRRWIELVLPDERTAGLPAARAIARIASGALAGRMGYIRQAIDQFAEAVRLAHQVEDARLIVRASWMDNFLFNPDHERAVRGLTEGLRLARENSMAWDAAQVQRNLGFFMYGIGRREEADLHWREWLDGLRTLGNIYHGVVERGRLGMLARERGDYAAARVQYEHRVTHARALRDLNELADDLIALAEVALRQEDAVGVLAAIREANTIYSKVGNLDRPGQCASLAARVAFMRGEIRRAAMLLGAADTLWRPYKGPFHLFMEDEYHRLLPLVRAGLDAADFDAAWAEGQQMTVRQVMAEIMTM